MIDSFKERPQRNFQNGQFLKGSVPFNKGKKWSEWMDGRKQRKVRRIAMQNLKPNMNLGGWNKRKVVMVSEQGTYRIFESASKASEVTGVTRENIGQVCRKAHKRKRAGGYYWFYWDSDDWIRKVKSIQAGLEVRESQSEKDARLYQERLDYIKGL